MQAELRYLPDEEAVGLAGALADSLEQMLPLARLHESASESDETIVELANLGLFAMCRPEDEGGAGVGVIEEALIAVELGRRLVAPEVMAMLGAAPAALIGPRSRVGAAWRTPQGILAVGAEAAHLLLLRDGERIRLQPAPTGPLQPVDTRHWLSPVHAVADAGADRPEPHEFSDEECLRVRLLDAAYLAGVAAAARDMAVAYAKLREQFGHPIGAFQAVKHRCADMAIAARRAADGAAFAAVALADGREEAALEVACALLAAGEAAIANAGGCIQVHGGIGFSDEADPHLTLKRARLAVALAGGLDAMAARVADIPPRL